MNARRRQAAADADTAKRADRFHKLRAALASESGLPETSARVEAAVWLTLALENQRAKILQGGLVDVSDMERLATSLKDILPPAASRLVVHFVDDVLCRKCGAEVPPEPAPAPMERAAQSVTPRRLPPPAVSIPAREEAAPPATPRPAHPGSVHEQAGALTAVSDYSMFAASNGLGFSRFDNRRI